MTNDSHNTDLLTRTLRDRSEQMAGSSLGLGDVKSRARGIRRRRQAVTGAVAAVVLAVAVPVGLTVTDAIDARPIPPAQQTQTPDPDKTDNALPQPKFPNGPVRLTADGVPEGPSPAVSYVVYDKNQLITPAGPVDLPDQTSMATEFRDGWLVLGGEGPRVMWVDADGNVVRSVPGGMTIAVSDDRRQVAWTEGTWTDREKTIVAAPVSGGEPQHWTIRTREAVDVIGFLGKGRVVFSEPISGQNGITEPDGSITELEGILSVRGASQSAGLVSVQSKYSIDQMCDGVVDPSASTSELLWESCDWKLGDFSPDGRYVVGTLPEADGMGSPSAAVLDARTGEVLVEFSSDRKDMVVLSQLAWEDNDSLVAVAVDRVDGLMLRLTLAGDIQRLGPTGSTANMSLPFRFAEVRP
jgi:hypothetical protein